MRVYSAPGQIDGLVRAWLAWRGTWAPTQVSEGVIWVGDESSGEDLLDALDKTWSDWGNGAPRPTVDWPRNED
jgi:hypothetical protein